jgi:capsular exopolysaccharide synthesis family protein
MRCPALSKIFENEVSTGLSEILAGISDDTESVVNSTNTENLDIVYCGKIPPNPSELLGSSRMESVLKKLKESFDFIIIDLPPVNIVSDAVAISPMLSGIIVVTREGYATKRDVDECFNQLELARVNILGCVMTCAARKGGSYGRYKYKYYGTEHE